MGEEIHLIEGNPENIKVTQKYDLLFADTLLKKNETMIKWENAKMSECVNDKINQ